MSPVGNATQFIILHIMHISNISKIKYNVNSTGVRGEVLSEEEEEEEYESDAIEYTSWGCDFCGKLFDSLNGATCHENLHCKQRPRGGGGGGWR